MEDRKKYYHIDRRGCIPSIFNEETIDKVFYATAFGSKRPNGYCGTILYEDNKNSIIQDFSIDENQYQLLLDDFKNENYHLPSLKLDVLIENFENTKNIKLRKFIIEVFLEQIRIEDFSDKPSRFTSIFLLPSLEDIEHWKKYLNVQEDVEPYTLFVSEEYKIVKLNIFLGDAQWINNPNFSDIEECKSKLENYWLGNMSDNPYKEILFQGVLLLKK